MLPALPIFLGLGTFSALLYSAKKGVDAYSDHQQAKELEEDSEELLSQAQQSLVDERKICTAQLEELGRLKLDAWDRQLGRFCSLFEVFRNVEVVGVPGVDQITWSKDELAEMERLSGYVNEVVSGGLTAVGTGALVGIASYGGATMLATASTGTAISSLAGVAASNATLAWFGGGALSAGGRGIAGGTAVLGGIIAASVLAVGFIVLAAKARENLANAKKNNVLAAAQVGELNAAKAVVRGIRRAATQMTGVITDMHERTTPVLDRLATVMASHGADFTKYPDSAKHEVYLAVQYVQCLKALVEAPILTKDGAVDEGYKKVLQRGRTLLADHAGG